MSNILESSHNLGKGGEIIISLSHTKNYNFLLFTQIFSRVLYTFMLK
jgi:hypothetical protein